ncbi:hypothetical protein MKW94_000685, partial [Papaver nudicaule]|nr:hypothetical protein [Papaver nudicaule]
RANELVKNKIHPTSIISGYRLAMREACKYIEEKLAVKEGEVPGTNSGIVYTVLSKFKLVCYVLFIVVLWCCCVRLQRGLL